jgi:hypothetical protein
MIVVTVCIDVVNDICISVTTVTHKYVQNTLPRDVTPFPSLDFL